MIRFAIPIGLLLFLACGVRLASATEFILRGGAIPQPPSGYTFTSPADVGSSVFLGIAYVASRHPTPPTCEIQTTLACDPAHVSIDNVDNPWGYLPPTYWGTLDFAWALGTVENAPSWAQATCPDCTLVLGYDVWDGDLLYPSPDFERSQWFDQERDTSARFVLTQGVPAGTEKVICVGHNQAWVWADRGPLGRECSQTPGPDNGWPTTGQLKVVPEPTRAAMLVAGVLGLGVIGRVRR